MQSCEASFKSLKNEALQSGVRVQLERVPVNFWVLGDSGPLQQVLLNLMKNGNGRYRGDPLPSGAV